MAQAQYENQVVLASQQPASGLLHDVFSGLNDSFADVFTGVDLTLSPSSLRKRYPELMPVLEALRLGSSQADAVARHLADAFSAQLNFQTGSDQQPLQTYLAEPAEPLSLQSHVFSGSTGWQPDLVYRGERWAAENLGSLAQHLRQRNVACSRARHHLEWVASNLIEGGRIDLSGRKIAVLGAAAEMAPTRQWLEAGADVLWLDVAPPPAQWSSLETLSGRLFWSSQPVDLLRMPREILATLQTFSEGQPLDLGLYAYAPGQMRELRLTGVMNALVDALPPGLVGSVTMLVSPTTPTALDDEDLQDMAARRASGPLWERTLATLGLMGRGDGAARSDGGAATRTIVGIQGVSYQIAQYLGKLMCAEAWKARGEFRVSANTAAITRTRSMSHPVFAAAFEGAGAFGVETLTPRQSRRLNGLLTLYDLLGPVQAHTASARIHGGIHTLPYPLESALRVAAAIGFARSPRLLRGLLQR